MLFSRIPQPWRGLIVYGGATLLLLIALLLTTVRLLLPQVEGYRAEVERAVSGYLGQPVRIARLEARLQILSPTLVLTDVQLLDRAGSKAIARFDEIRVGLAAFESLVLQRVVLNEITVVGPSLAVERRLDGSLRITGLVQRDDQSDPEAIGRWLLAQHRIHLRDSRVVWRDARTARTFTFEGATIELQNSGERHRLNGRVQLPAELGGTLSLAVDMEGDPFAAGGLHGGFHVAANQIKPAGLLRLFPVEGLTPGGGELTAAVWGEWKEARLVSAEGQVQGHELVFASRDRRETLSAVAARFQWTRGAQGWQLAVDDLALTHNGRAWPATRLRVDLIGGGEAPERGYTLHASFLRLEDLAAIAALVPVRGAWQQRLAELAPRGDASAVRLEFGPHGALRGGARFTDLSVQANGQQPGFSGFDGYAWYADGAAGVRLATRDAQLDLRSLFRAPLVLKQLDGELHLQRDGSAWRVSSAGLAAANDDIQVRTALELRLPDRGAPFLDLHGDFRDGRAVTVPRYLPAHIMNASAVEWLDHAFKGGRVVRGGVLVHGRLDQFPFDHGEGRFQVAFDASEVELDYMPHWPHLTRVEGAVEFDGRSLRIESPRAELFGSQVSDTVVAVPDLVNARLLVNGHVTGTLNNLFDYLRVSGLAGHFDSALAQFAAGGPYALDLAFEQPLSDDPPQAAAKVRGRVTFDGARLGVAHGVEFSEVRGQLRFTDDRYVSDRLTARLFDAPATIRVSPGEGGEVTRVALDGALDGKLLRRALNLPLLARLQGRSKWDGQLILAHQEGRESTLRLHSTLAGMALQLPEPLAKRAEERRETTANLWFSGARAGELDLTYGDRLTAALALPAEETPLRAAFHFGTALPKVPADGYLISGRLPDFAPGPWFALLNETRAAPADQRNRTVAAPAPVRVDLDELGIVMAPESESKVPAPGGDLATAPLPRLDVRIGALRYNRLQLGALSFHTENLPGRVALKDFNLRAAAFALSGHGQWRRGRRPRTEVDLRAVGKDLGVAARELGIASVIDKGAFDLNAVLDWDGDPQALDVANLEGTLQVKLKDGNLTEVKPGAGRLIGLLSLQALPQRLTLDFHDLFDKGMRFRTVEGTFNFRNGDAFSDNLHMNALPAAVFVSGRTGLVKRDFDQTITVIPDVSGTLPVAGGLMLGPQVGAALLLVERIFHKKIDEAAKFKYAVSGGWDNPVVQRVSKKR